MQMHSQDSNPSSRRISNNPIYSKILERVGQLRLTDYARQLAQLSLRAWIEEEHLLLKQPNPAQMEELAVKITERVLADPRVQGELESRRFVSFGVLLVSLADSTTIVLTDAGFKGKPQQDPKGKEQS